MTEAVGTEVGEPGPAREPVNEARDPLLGKSEDECIAVAAPDVVGERPAGGDVEERVAELGGDVDRSDRAPVEIGNQLGYLALEMLEELDFELAGTEVGLTVDSPRDRGDGFEDTGGNV